MVLLLRNADEMFRVMTGTVAQPEPEPLNVENLLEDWRKMLFNARRTQITFVVDLAHEGPIIQHQTPCDGTRVEMSVHQALALFDHWPIKLHKVLEPTVAEFVPVSGLYPEFVSKSMLIPPWDMPPDDETSPPDREEA